MSYVDKVALLCVGSGVVIGVGLALLALSAMHHAHAVQVNEIRRWLREVWRDGAIEDEEWRP